MGNIPIYLACLALGGLMGLVLFTITDAASGLRDEYRAWKTKRRDSAPADGGKAK